MQATLVVVGTRDHSRMAGITLGSVSTHLLHEAPCSVLVARRPVDRDMAADDRGGRRRLPGSAAALAAARELAARAAATLRPVAATSEPFVDVEAARRSHRTSSWSTKPSCTLHVVSQEADLVVVGSRGLRGIRALGSVSERIAHEARCSVLVVRVPVE